MQTGDIHSPRMPGLTLEYLFISGFAIHFVVKFYYFAMTISTLNIDFFDVFISAW